MKKLNIAIVLTVLLTIHSCYTKTKEAKQTTENASADPELNTKAGAPSRLGIPIPNDKIVDEFYEAIFSNDNTKAREMLETKFPANYEPKNKISPLQAVISTSDNLYLAKLLVEKGANINGKKEPVTVSCAEYGRLGILKYLVGLKVDIESNEAFNNAGFHQHYECAKFLLVNGANQEKGDIRGKLWVVEQAVIKSDYEVLNLVHLTLAELNSNNCEGETSLIIAVKQNNREMVSYLLKRGADKNKRETFDCGDDIHYGKTPLKIAVENDYEAIVKLIKAS